jgi:hypothetical protein
MRTLHYLSGILVMAALTTIALAQEEKAAEKAAQPSKSVPGATTDKTTGDAAPKPSKSPSADAGNKNTGDAAAKPSKSPFVESPDEGPRDATKPSDRHPLPGMIGDCGEPACRSNCPNFFTCNVPRGFYADAEALFMVRDNRTTRQPVVIDVNSTPGEDTLVTTRDLSFPLEPGLRARVGYRLNDCFAVDVEYMGLFNSFADHCIAGDNNLAIPGAMGLASNDFYGADDMRLTYSSQLHSIEINGLRWCECYSCGDCCQERSRHWWREWFVGFRYLELDEEFNIRSTDLQEGTGDYNIRTRNHLFGGQLGTRWGRSNGRLGLELTGKAGVFGNAASQRQYATDFPSPFMLRPETSSEDGHVAFVGELGATVSWQLNRVWAARCGYNLMWIEGVALAPDQLDFTNTPDSGTCLTSTGGVFLHGLSVGLEARW